jgi:hypothetical protein
MLQFPKLSVTPAIRSESRAISGFLARHLSTSSSQTRCYWQRTRHRRTISVSFRSFTQRTFPSVSVALASLLRSRLLCSINLLFLIKSGCGLSSGCREAWMTPNQVPGGTSFPYYLTWRRRGRDNPQIGCYTASRCASSALQHLMHGCSLSQKWSSSAPIRPQAY